MAYTIFSAIVLILLAFFAVIGILAVFAIAAIAQDKFADDSDNNSISE